MKWIGTAVMICGVWLGVSAQATQNAQKLESGQRVDREIAGGQSHQYQITLAAGQFMRLTVQKKGIDVAIQLIAPDGKLPIEAAFTGPFGQESLCQEVAVGGDYHIVIRTVATTASKGAYEATMKANSGRLLECS